MSQTETLLLILVGFSLAALLFLFLARVVWHAGVKLGARRSRRKAPANVAELQSERDSLRGEYARLSQKLSSRLAQAKFDMAEQMAEVSRHRNRLAQLAIDLNSRDITIDEQRSRIAGLEEEVAERGESLNRAELELQAVRNDLARTREEAANLRSELDSVRAIPGELPPVDAAASAQLVMPDDRLKQRIDHLAGLSQEIAAQRAAGTAADSAALLDPLLQEKLEAVSRETADLQEELARLDAAWASKLGDVPGQSADSDRPPRAVANVISLAQRIRASQKDVAS